MMIPPSWKKKKTGAGASAHFPAQVNGDTVLHSEGAHKGG